ncbi:MAG TPA: FAD-binding oxidoreductase [Pseudomonadales bacterium]|nr:FAD-binding oxidoreductase [Pseudomonadales bacterium]
MTELLERLAARLGPGGVLTGTDVTDRAAGIWRSDALQARAILRPRSTDDVAFVLAECHAVGQAVVTHGGLTGLVHGADAGPEDLILSTERMNRVESIDPLDRTITVQAGVPLQVLQEAAAEHGLIFPLDLGARGSCVIGGNLATNAGGNRVLRYGMTRENTLGIEAVLADGTVIPALNRMIKNNSGFDLKQWFIGTEGTLGVITRAVLRLREAPKSRMSALVALQDFEAVAGLLKHLDAGLGGMLSSFEVMWRNFYEVVAQPPVRATPPMSTEYPFYVLCEAMGGDPASDGARFEAVLAEAMEQGMVVDAIVATSEAQQADLWSMRDSVGALLEFGPNQIFDVSLPISEMPAYVARVEQGMAELSADARLFTFGHLGDGNLHFLAVPGDGSEETVERVERIVYEPLAAIGGAISAEHGIGVEKKRWLHLSRNPAEIELMQRMRAALDPRGILNPGKVI